jgi:hypothetical protein
MRYRVWLHGSSMTASYDGHVDVNAEDAEDAKDKALTKLTAKNGTFFDWSKSMFKVDKVEQI